MTDVLHRLQAYSTAPDVYDAPTPAECQAAVGEIKRLRERLQDLDRQLRWSLVMAEVIASRPTNNMEETQ